MLTQTPRLPVLLAQEAMEQPPVIPVPQPTISGPWAAIIPALIVVAFFVGEVAGVSLKRKLDANPELKQKAQDFEENSKDLARNAARILQVAEMVAPPLRATPIDNHIREVLIAYANSNISFFKETEALHVSPSEVADFVDAACPELLGECINLPPVQAANVMRQVAREAVSAKASTTLDVDSEAFKLSKQRTEELLLSLRSNRGQ